MYTRFRNISYVMAYAVATIPLWYYVTDDRIMLLMTLVVGFAYVNVVLSSVDAAQGILTSEKTKIPMPRWLPDNLKYQKWWAIKQHILRWHILLIPAKLGLALGFVEWLHLGIGWSYLYTILRPYLYLSHVWIPTYPQWETVFLSIATITLFSLLECGLIAALCNLTSHPSKALMIRILLALSAIGVINLSQNLRTCCCYYYPCVYTNEIRVRETIETTFFMLDDTGILLAANMMRPQDAGFYPWGTPDKSSGYNDSRPFVARQLIAALLGVLMYLATIFTVLRFVRDSDLVVET